MQLRLTEILNEETSCYVRTPTGMTCNLKVIDVVEQSEKCNERISYWTENGECGIYIKNVQMSDTGMWRIISTNSTNHKLLDAAYVEVLDEIKVTNKHKAIWSGLNYTLMFEDTYTEKFCMVDNPYGRFNTSVMIMKKDCNVELSPVTRIHDKNWSAIIAKTGQIEETVETINITVIPKHLDYGYQWSKNFTLLQLYCNLIADDNEIKICRFSRAPYQTGFRLRDGLRKGMYGYYGAGLAKGQCGLAIYNPNRSDYGQWYCSVVSKDESVFSASIWITVNSITLPEIPYSAIKAWSTPSITPVNKELNLTCFTNVPLTYCWFSLPNGETLISLTASSDKQDLRSSYSMNLSNGICSVKVINATIKHSGVWTCHMGAVSSGIEISTNVTVKITDTPLVTKESNIFVKLGTSAIIECITVPSPAPVQYCRFFSSNGLGININEQTKNKPIKRNGMKYYLNGTNFKLGRCQLIIENVRSEHIGEWTCAAMLERGETHESFDTIILFANAEEEEGSIGIAAAGIGVGVMSILIIIVAVALITVKKWRSSLNIPYFLQKRNRRSTLDTDSLSRELALQTVTRRNTSSSNDSFDSH